MAELAKCGIPLHTACHNSKGQNGVTITSNSQPPMVLSSTHTHAHLHTDTHTGAHTMMLHTTFPGLTAWLGLSLQKAGLSVSEKFSSHSSEGQKHYLHLHLCQPPPRFPQPFFTLSRSLSLSPQCLTHSTTCESRWTRVANSILTAVHRFCAFRRHLIFFCLNLFEGVHHESNKAYFTCSFYLLCLPTWWTYLLLNESDWT